MALQLRVRTCGAGSEPCFVQGSLLQLPYAEQSFDAGMSVDVLEHIAPEDVAQVVKEFTRVVRHYLLLHPAAVEERTGSGEALGIHNVHLTTQDYAWWASQFAEEGWT